MDAGRIPIRAVLVRREDGSETCFKCSVGVLAWGRASLLALEFDTEPGERLRLSETFLEGALLASVMLEREEGGLHVLGAATVISCRVAAGDGFQSCERDDKPSPPMAQRPRARILLDLA